MRTFVQGSGPERKIVRIEIQGSRMAVVTGKGDGSSKRNEKLLPSAAEAAAAGERMAREVIARGYVEVVAPSRKPAPTLAPSRSGAPQPSASAARARQVAEEPAAAYSLAEALDDEAEEAAPLLPRLAATAAQADASTRTKTKPKKKSKKKKKKAADGEKTDWLALGGVGVLGIAILGLIGWFVMPFFEPATLLGTWQGSRVTHEIGQSLTYDHYRMTFNDQGRVLLIRQEEIHDAGTYQVKGDRLHLDLSGEISDSLEYKFALSRGTLELFDPSDGKSLVKLIKMSETDVVPAPGQAPAVAGGAPGAAGPVATLPELNPALVSVAASAKDGSFSLRHPPGWDARGGSRPDNTYAWAEFTNGSAKVRVDADVKGSLMADISTSFGGSPDPNEETPVASIHELKRREMGDTYEEYQEGDPVPFTSASLGEGRIAEFTAAGSGLFASKVHGYRATLLSNDRRVTVLCECPESDWATLKPTFFAVVQSFGR